jgi:hypothetical protein
MTWRSLPRGTAGRACRRDLAAQARRPVRPDRGPERRADREGHVSAAQPGTVLVSAAIAIALGATAMADIAVLGQPGDGNRTRGG